MTAVHPMFMQAGRLTLVRPATVTDDWGDTIVDADAPPIRTKLRGYVAQDAAGFEVDDNGRRGVVTQPRAMLEASARVRASDRLEWVELDGSVRTYEVEGDPIAQPWPPGTLGHWVANLKRVEG